MVSSNTTAGYGTAHDTAVPKYSTGIAKVVNSALYRHTLGAAVESRIGRVLLLAFVWAGLAFLTIPLLIIVAVSIDQWIRKVKS